MAIPSAHLGRRVLDREVARFQPYLPLSPDEALEQAKTVPPTEKPLLEKLAGVGWGPIQMYFRLSPQQQAALRAGETLFFSEEPGPGQYPLPKDLARGVLQCNRHWRVVKRDDGGINASPAGERDTPDPKSVPLTALPEMRAMIYLQLTQWELGQFTLDGASGFFAPPGKGGAASSDMLENLGPYAVGTNTSVNRSEGGPVNPRLTHHPTLRLRISIQPQPSCNLSTSSGGERSDVEGEVAGPASKVTSADVLEVLHHATGVPIISDFYTRLYKPEAVSLTNQPLSQVLGQLVETMRLRWNKEEGWLQFRSATYYHDRLKEVPHRLLAGWSADRRQQTGAHGEGGLTLDQIVEIAQLSDDQLKGAEMAEGAMEIWGLKEWHLLGHRRVREHARFLGEFTPAQRQEMMSVSGLPFTRMSLPQQQGFMSRALRGNPLQSLEELAGATLRVDYTQPGWYQWPKPGDFSARRWVVPVEPGPKGRRVLMPPVRERTPEEALRAARRAFPSVSASLVEYYRQSMADVTTEKLLPQPEQIAPTVLDLVIVYIPGTSNAHLVRWVSAHQDLNDGGGLVDCRPLPP